jgi:pyruvate/2-oxoglutarate dehydrogenase complex dihydrolipoamide dehydrogenase (E3) component
MAVAARPDVVVVVTGSVPQSFRFPGLEGTCRPLASELLAGGHDVERPAALVIGRGMVGFETADFLAARGKQVTLVEMRDDVGADMDPLAKAVLAKRLAQRRVVIHTSTRIVQFTESAALAVAGDREIELPIGTVVLAVGAGPNRAPADALANKPLGSPCHWRCSPAAQGIEGNPQGIRPRLRAIVAGLFKEGK